MGLLGICKCQVYLGVHVNDIAILAFLVLGLKAKGMENYGVRTDMLDLNAWSFAGMH